MKWKADGPGVSWLNMPIPKQHFYFLRHGQTDWNVEARFQGHTDMPLTAAGVQQAQDAAQALAHCPVDLIVASPLIRALKTAAIVAERLDKPLFVDSELKERHFGAFEGLVVAEVKAKLGVAPHERLVRHLPPDAEQWHETRARSARVIGRWLGRNPGRTLLFVTHSGLFDALHEQIFGTRVEPKHVPYLWQPEASGWTCKAL
jgi:broad specificity phosphatase PhoE